MRKKPPRTVWHVLCDNELTSGSYLTRKAALGLVKKLNRPEIGGVYTVAGPYILAERVRER